MLYHFLNHTPNNKSNANLFQNLKIAQHKEYIEQYQGRYPVIYITFKDIVKEKEYEAAYKGFCNDDFTHFIKEVECESPSCRGGLFMHHAK